MNATDPAQETQWRRWRAVADLYHAYFTGLILTVVTRRGTADAAEFVFRVFRRQQQERFLPGLEKLGLRRLPPAVAAALDMEGHCDLRRARRGLARDAARLARQ